MSREEQFDFYWKEIFDGLAYNPIEFNVYRFDQTMSLPSKVNKLYDMFKQLALNNQEVMDYLKEFVETFEFKLETTVTDVLNVWLDDGKLADILLQVLVKLDEVKDEIHNEIEIVSNELNETNKKIDSIVSIPIHLLIDIDNGSDVTNKLNDFLELNKGGNIVFPSNKEIVVSDLINVHSDTRVDFNNCQLIYRGNKDYGELNAYNRDYGIVNVWGKRKTTEFKISEIEQYLAKIPNNTPPTGFDGYSTPFSNVTRLKVVGHSFHKGDYVIVLARNYKRGGDWDDKHRDNPATFNHVLARILEVDNQYIFVDFATDFVIDVNSEKYTSTIYGVDVTKNVTIENLRLKDIRQSNDYDSTPTAQRGSWVGGVSLRYGVNCVINNLKSESLLFSNIISRHNNSCSFSKIFYEKPKTIKNGGCGYNIEVVSSLYNIVDEATSYNSRHNVDFTGSMHCKVYNSKTFNDFVFGYSFHGQGEYDITLINCYGNVQIGHGSVEFPEITSKINLENHVGIVRVKWVNKLNIINSHISFCEVIMPCQIINLNIENTTIESGLQNTVLKPMSRGIYNNPEITFKNVKIKIKNYEMLYLFKFEGYLNILMDNVEIISNQQTNLFFTRCKNVTVINSRLINVYNEVNNVIPDLPPNNIQNELGVYHFEKNYIESNIAYTYSRSFIELKNQDKYMTIELFDNVFNGLSGLDMFNYMRYGKGITIQQALKIFSNNFHNSVSYSNPNSVSVSLRHFFNTDTGNPRNKLGFNYFAEYGGLYDSEIENVFPK